MIIDHQRTMIDDRLQRLMMTDDRQGLKIEDRYPHQHHPHQHHPHQRGGNFKTERGGMIKLTLINSKHT